MSAAVAFVIGLGGVALVTAWQVRHSADVAAARFDAVAQRAAEQIALRLDTYQYGLRGARGTVVSAGSQRLDRDRFRLYSRTRDIDSEFPGARGMGLIWRVPAADEGGFVESARRDGFPDFSVRQIVPHDGERYVIQYVEPIDRNREAVGLDIGSEANRRDAAERAMRTGKATLTRPITLVQAAGKPRNGFLLLLPIYRPGTQPQTPEQREAEAIGWAYAPLVIDEVLRDFNFLDGEFTFTLTDVAGSTQQVFFEPADAAQPPAGGLVRRVAIPVFGSVWQADVRALPSFMKGLDQRNPNVLWWSGVAVSALVSYLVYLLAQSSQRALWARAEQARRAAIVESSNDAIVGFDAEGRVLDWNPAAERMFGHLAEAVTGRLLSELWLPDDRPTEDAAMLARLRRGEQIAAFDTVRCARDGILVDVSIGAAAVTDARGRFAGGFKTLRDITESKSAERLMNDANRRLESQVADRTALLEAARRDLKNILDAVPSLIGYWDRTLHNRFANQAYGEWFGIDVESVPGMHLSELLGVRFEANQAQLQGALRGEPQRFERSYSRYLPNGQVAGERHALTQYLPDVVDGEVRGFYALVTDISEQVRDKAWLAAALRDNEALLQTLHQHAIVSVADRAGRIVEANDRFCAISGYTRDELMGQNHRIVNSGVQPAAFWQDMWQTISAGRPWRGDICNRARDGSLYWVDSMIAPVMGEDGRVDRYISIRTDITTAKLAEQRLRASESFLDRTGQMARVGGWTLELATGQLEWTDETCRIHEMPVGYQPTLDEAVHFYAPEARPVIEAAVEHAIATGTGWDLELPFITALSRHIWVRAIGEIEHADGKPARLVGAFQDVTARKHAEEALQARERLMRMVIDSFPGPLAHWDLDERCTLANEAYRGWMGMAPEQMLGRTRQTIFGADVSSQHGTAVAAVLRGEPQQIAGARRDMSGRTREFVLHFVPDRDGDTVRGFISFVIDVTELKQIQRQLQQRTLQAEHANRAKSQFLANMSHEVRTPMNAVIGLAYLIGQTPLDAEQAALLAKIRVASKSLLTVINDILDFSKIEAGELAVERSVFSLPALLQELAGVTALQAQAKGIAFDVRLPADLPAALLGDETRLTQILTNLLSNAIKFTDRGGVTLDVRVQEASSARVSLRFAVRDTGIGIDEAAQARLFTPFVQADASTTRRFGGTGLGLSIVKRLASLMHGEVGLGSRPGVGSEFWVELPFEPAAVDDLPAAAQSPRALVGGRLAGVRVLVVDDSDINLEVARRILELEGARVQLASHGEQAVTRLRAAPGAFDAVLMDVQMPVMDGHEATRRIRAELGLGALPIIALTAGALTSERERALEAGMDDFVSKPFDPQALVACLRRHAGSDPGRPVPAWGRSLAPAPAVTAVWPEIEGIDRRDVESRLGGDAPLFCAMLRRLFGEFGDLCDADAPPGPADSDAQRARLHKLRGSASMLGAHAVADLAGQAEAACAAADAARAARLAPQLAEALRQLRAHAAPALHAPPAPDAASPPRAARAEPVDPQCLAELLARLQHQSLSALDVFAGLSDQLRDRLGAPTYERLRSQIESLQFSEAAQTLAAVDD